MHVIKINDDQRDLPCLRRNQRICLAEALVIRAAGVVIFIHRKPVSVNRFGHDSILRITVIASLPFSIDENRVPFIKLCIHELAEYERSAEKDESTEDMLRENIFERGFAKVLIAEYAGEKIAYALWFNNFSTWLARPGIYLEDLYVRPQFRHKGVGKALLQRLADIAVENGWGRLEWSCLKWNTPSLDFYESLGANRLDEWVTLRVDGENLKHFGNS